MIEFTGIKHRVIVNSRALELVMDVSGAAWICKYQHIGGPGTTMRRQRALLPEFGPITSDMREEDFAFPHSEYVRLGRDLCKRNENHAARLSSKTGGAAA